MLASTVIYSNTDYVILTDVLTHDYFSSRLEYIFIIYIKRLDEISPTVTKRRYDGSPI